MNAHNKECSQLSITEQLNFKVPKHYANVCINKNKVIKYDKHDNSQFLDFTVISPTKMSKRNAHHKECPTTDN